MTAPPSGQGRPRLRIGVVGIGKIARDQHLPVLADDPAFELAACASRHARVEGVANFPDVASMLDACPDLDCVAICTPPRAHFEAARAALVRGRHVLLEKPPAATTRQVAVLVRAAEDAGRTLFLAWHSRFAAGVEPARQWLLARRVLGGRIAWKEDVHAWHPGQRWIWEPGGFGVFDPGINALSILTAMLSSEVCVESAVLHVPSNAATPAAAELALRTDDGAAITAEFDFRQAGKQAWDIELDTDGGTLQLSRGGAGLSVDGRSVDLAPEGSEYQLVYRRFSALCAENRSEADARPLQLVADAFLVGHALAAGPVAASAAEPPA